VEAVGLDVDFAARVRIPWRSEQSFVPFVKRTRNCLHCITTILSAASSPWRKKICAFQVICPFIVELSLSVHAVPECVHGEQAARHWVVPIAIGIARNALYFAGVDSSHPSRSILSLLLVGELLFANFSFRGIFANHSFFFVDSHPARKL